MHGEIWNHSKLSESLGVTAKTVAHYREILETLCILRVLESHTVPGIRKRQVKTPRVYLRDSGLLHRLLRIDGNESLFGHPVRAASWKGYVIEQIAATVPKAKLSFYRTARGAAIDLLVEVSGQRTAIGILPHSAPQTGPEFRAALVDVRPDNAWVAAPVRDAYPIGDGITVAPPNVICEALLGE
jgi:predicted AAA+ superfamily ATPase